jgi:hypothetical protein
MRKIVFLVSTCAAICIAVPSLAQELDVRIGEGHRDRDREIVRSHAEYHRDRDRTIVVRRDRDHDHRWHHDRDRDRKVIIER